MKRIITTFGDFRTGDDIADAVGRYGLALAKVHETDMVEIPYRSANGDVDRIELRIGWLVDIGIAHGEGDRDGEELLEPETVRLLRDTALSVERLGFVPEDLTRFWTKWEYDL